MNLLAIAFYAALGIALFSTHGQFDDTAVLAIFAFFLTCLGALGRLARGNPSREVSASRAQLVAGGVIVVFLGLLSYFPGPVYANPQSGSYSILAWGIRLAFVVSIWGVAELPKKAERSASIFFGIAALLWALKIVALIAAPTPYIDTWVFLQQAADYLRQGQNPYSQTYPDIYGGQFGGVTLFPYWPGVVVFLAPFRWLLSDVRYGYVAAELLSGLAFWIFVRGGKQSRLFAALLAALWFSFPVSYFVLEQSWIDGLLAPVALLACALLVRLNESSRARDWVVAGLAFGWAFSIKQYAIWALALAIVYAWRVAKARATALLCAGAAASATLITAPFLLWDFKGFRHNTLEVWSAWTFRKDSFSMNAWFWRKWDWTVPDAVMAALALGVLALAAAAILRQKSRSAFSLFLGVSSAYAVTFLFGKMAFCNYYYFLASFLLLASFSQPQSEPPIPAPPGKRRS